MIEIRLDFQDASDIYPGVKSFYIQSDNLPSLYGINKRGNISINRAVNKNLTQTALPVSTYKEGGLCVDIGFCDDTFSIDYETHSWYEYRLLTSLVKCNTGLKSGDFIFGEDKFSFVMRNCSFGFVSGRGGYNSDHNDMYIKVSMTLTIVNSKFTK